MTLKKQKYNRIIGWFLNVLILLASIFILVGIYYVVQIKILKNDYANLFGYTFFEVATGSMSSTIEVGDIIIVKLTKDIKENDIIVFKEENSFVTHRFIKKEEGQLITKGDANNSEDKPIFSEQVLGQVVSIIPKIGIWRKILLTPEVLVLIVIIILLLGIAFIHTSKTEEKNER